MPSFRNVQKQEMDFQRGYMVAFAAAREGWHQDMGKPTFGFIFRSKRARQARSHSVQSRPGSHCGAGCRFGEGLSRRRI